MKPMRVGAMALMVLMLATGCDRVQKAARDLAGDDDGGGPAPATKPVAVHAAASSSAAASSVVAIIDPPDTQVGDWHIAMAAACAAGKAEHVAHYDINGDGLPDTVCWRVIRTKAYGDFVDVDARVTTGDTAQSAYRLLPANGKGAMALCNADHIGVRQTLTSQADLDRKGWGADHRIGITVESGGCAPVRLFWPAGDTGDEVDFRYAR